MSCYGKNAWYNVFVQGDTPVFADLYHLEHVSFGYHDFILLADSLQDVAYLCDSWPELYPMRITAVDRKEFEADMRKLALGEGSNSLSRYFERTRLAEREAPRISSLSFHTISKQS